VRRRLALAAVAVVAVAGWIAVRDVRRGYVRTYGASVRHETLHSRLLHRDLEEVLVAPRGGGRGRPLLVLLHGRSSKPDSMLRDALLPALAALGRRAPDVLLANGGDHSYWHDRRDGPWGSYVVREAIPWAVGRLHADGRRVAIGGISMGGFGALDLARLHPRRFCAVGGHSAALWTNAGETAAGAFDDADDYARHDVTLAHYRMPVWIDVGTDDPFRSADTLFAIRVHADFHVWPGGHGGGYWKRHMRAYLRWYATELARC
jgi:enterochelin esterase-like enzyme